MNWINPDNFRLLRSAVEVSLCGDKVHRTMLTDRNVPEHTLRVIVPNLIGILNKYVKCVDIIVGMVYPTQAGNRGLLGLSDRFFLKDNIIKTDHSNNKMRRPGVISIIGQMAQCNNRGICIYHWN